MLYFCGKILSSFHRKRRVSSFLSKQQQRAAAVHRIKKQQDGFARLTFVIVLVFYGCYVPFLVSFIDINVMHVYETTCFMIRNGDKGEKRIILMKILSWNYCINLARKISIRIQARDRGDNFRVVGLKNLTQTNKR